MNWVLKDRWRLKEKWHSKPKRLARADRHQQVTGTQEQWAVMAEPEHVREKPSIRLALASWVTSTGYLIFLSLSMLFCKMLIIRASTSLGSLEI